MPRVKREADEEVVANEAGPSTGKRRSTRRVKPRVKREASQEVATDEAGPSTRQQRTSRQKRSQNNVKQAGTSSSAAAQSAIGQGQPVNPFTTPKQSQSSATRLSAQEAALERAMNRRAGTRRNVPSTKALERLERVLQQRMFLLHREPVESQDPFGLLRGHEEFAGQQIPGGEQFKILGSTGKVYTVNVCDTTSCDCPDALINASGVCKHVIFVFIKVLGVAPSDHFWYQKALTPAERQLVFREANPDPTSSNPALQRAYREAVGNAEQNEASPRKAGTKVARRVPQDSDICAVCYEEFGATKGEVLYYCDLSCGNALHRKCADEWQKHCRREGKGGYVCVYCNFSRRDMIQLVRQRNSRGVEDGYMSLTVVEQD